MGEDSRGSPGRELGGEGETGRRGEGVSGRGGDLEKGHLNKKPRRGSAPRGFMCDLVRCSAGFAGELNLLLHKHKPLYFHEGTSSESVEIDPACQAVYVEPHRVRSRRLSLVHQRRHLAAQQVVHRKLHVTDTWPPRLTAGGQVIPDPCNFVPTLCSGIERVRIVQLQGKRCPLDSAWM